MSNRDEQEHGKLSFTVGQDRALSEILKADEVLPLLKAVAREGIEAGVQDAGGSSLWTYGRGEGPVERLPLRVEGEVVGFLTVRGAGCADAAACVIVEAINQILQANLRRMLTTEIHTQVVNQSVEDLSAANARLRASEQRYRELAEQLEERVRERGAALEQAHARLLQQEKMASLGCLAAGLAHEINNPMGFITSNLNTLRTYLARCREILAFCRRGEREEALPAAFVQAFQEHWRRLMMDTVLSDADSLLQESLDGAARIKGLVADLRGVSHIDDASESVLDLNREIDMLLRVLAYATPAGAEIVKNYGELPLLRCKPALLTQGLFPIILNGLQARGEGLVLTITTRRTVDQLVIRIADNGPGIAPEIRSRIFEPFFTTREVGQGKGLGLSTAYDAITAQGGTITVEGKNGAVFEVRLPFKEETCRNTPTCSDH